MGYNDQIALSVPLETGFRGAVPGKFLELIKVGADKGQEEISLTQTGQELVVKQGRRTNFRLAMLEPNFVFEMPTPQINSQANEDSAMEAFIDALAHCLISVGRDTSAMEQLGITLEPQGSTVVMYATDGATISRAKLTEPFFQLQQRVILPTMFCEQMLALYQSKPKDTRTHFELGRTETNGAAQNYALFRAGRTRLYGRLLESRSPLNFSGTIEYHLPPGNLNSKLVEVPGQLQAAVERACIVCDAQRRLTHVTVADGRMLLRSKSDTEEVTDELRYRPREGTASQLEVKLEPKLLKKAHDYDKMLIHGTCVVMSKGPSIYLISCSTA